MTPLPIRLRVAVAFALTSAVALVGLGGFVYYRVDATLAEQSRGSLEAQLDALLRLPVEGRVSAAEAMTGESFAQVLSPSGEVLGSSPHVDGPLLPAEQIDDLGDRPVILERPVHLDGEDEREVAMLAASEQGGQVLVVGTSQERVEEALDGLLTQLLVGIPLALLVASAAGYLVAGSALRPVERMRQHAARVSARSSAERLPVPPGDDELSRLGRTLNAMLERLDAGLKRERRFVAEASHELRTPLSLLRLELDLALSRPRSRDEQVAALRSATEEVDRLARLAEDLLLLAASDEQRLALDLAEVDTAALLRRVRDRFSAEADRQGRAIRVTGAFPLVVRADEARLDQAMSNLLDNALRHGDGDVELSARAQDGTVCLRVSDEGSGPDPGLQDQAFERFGRTAGARTAAGRGLGLSIVRAIVEAHGGTVTLDATPGRPGTVVTITLVAPARG